MAAWLILFLLLEGSRCDDFLVVQNEIIESNVACCKTPDILSCRKASIDPSLLGQASISLFGGAKVSFMGDINNNTRTFKYSDNNETEALFTYDPITKRMNGFIDVGERNFVLEFCGDQGHVVKEMDTDSIVEEEEHEDQVSSISVTSDTSGEDYFSEMMSAHYDYNNDNQEDEDTSTVVTYSVQVYYTQELADSTSDIKDFLELVISETNEGYQLSQVPLRIKLHCAQKVNIPDSIKSRWSIWYLERLKPTIEEVKNSADVAVLIVNDFPRTCGQARMDTLNKKSKDYGKSLAVVKKSCITIHTFGHEIAHTIGLYHDKRHYNKKYPYAHGSYIEKGDQPHGLRTIMAYQKPGYKNRVPYYSNPKVIHPRTGTPTGQARTANNARLLTEMRFKLASMGDESRPCSSETINIETCQDYYEKECPRRVRFLGCKGKVLENCRKSCSVCVVSTTPTKCYDKSKLFCQFMKTSCKDDTYKQWMSENCAKTCQLC